MSVSTGQSNLNGPEGAPPPGVTPDYNNPVNQQHYDQAVITLVIFVVASTITTFLRLWTRLFIVRRPGWDDVCAFVATAFGAGHSAAVAMTIHYGGAYYDWNITLGDFLKNDEWGTIYWHAVGGLLFFVVYCFIKLSILFFYLRILGKTEQKYRIFVYFVMGITVAVTIGSIIVDFTHCDPPLKLFNSTLPGTCKSFDKVEQLFEAQTIISAITDMFILVPPIPIIWTLSASTRRKIGILSILCGGFVVTAIAIARCILEFAPGDQIQSLFFGTYLTVVELNLALMIVNLPALSQLFVRTTHHIRKPAALADPELALGSPDEQGIDHPSPGGHKKHRSPISLFISAFNSRIEVSRSDRSLGRSVNRMTGRSTTDRSTTEPSTTDHNASDRIVSRKSSHSDYTQSDGVSEGPSGGRSEKGESYGDENSVRRSSQGDEAH